MTSGIGYYSDDDDEDTDELRERAFTLWRTHGETSSGSSPAFRGRAGRRCPLG